MNYKLAKQLKDAGFEQDGGEGRYIDETGEQFFGIGIQEIPSPNTIIPTLSELIRACGRDFWEVYQSIGGHWNAKASGGETIDCKECGHRDVRVAKGDGKTPEEAVAKLWLTLKKDN